jgi:hypothetical protein
VKPIEFQEQNCVYAKDQPEYLPLPAFKFQDGLVICCWGLSWRERVKALLFGRLWLSVMTFNKPLQPLLPQLTSPFVHKAAPKTRYIWSYWGRALLYIWLTALLVALTVVGLSGLYLDWKTDGNHYEESK